MDIKKVNPNLLKPGLHGDGVLINDETGEVVGVSINESADIRVMQNMPYGPNQK